MSENLTAEQVLKNNRALHLIGRSAKGRIIDSMEEYAAQQVQEYRYTSEILAVGHSRLNRENEKMIELLDECRLQLEYMDKRFPTGTTPNILSRVQDFLTSINKVNG